MMMIVMTTDVIRSVVSLHPQPPLESLSMSPHIQKYVESVYKGRKDDDDGAMSFSSTFLRRRVSVRRKCERMGENKKTGGDIHSEVCRQKLLWPTSECGGNGTSLPHGRGGVDSSGRKIRRTSTWGRMT